MHVIVNGNKKNFPNIIGQAIIRRPSKSEIICRILYCIVSFFYIMIFITSVFILVNNSSYLYFIVILELLSLEILFVIFFYRSIVFSLGDFLMMITLVTSEAALGLTLIVTILRVNGSDIVSNKNVTVY